MIWGGHETIATKRWASRRRVGLNLIVPSVCMFFIFLHHLMGDLLQAPWYSPKLQEPMKHVQRWNLPRQVSVKLWNWVEICLAKFSFHEEQGLDKEAEEWKMKRKTSEKRSEWYRKNAPGWRSSFLSVPLAEFAGFVESPGLLPVSLSFGCFTTKLDYREKVFNHKMHPSFRGSLMP